MFSRRIRLDACNQRAVACSLGTLAKFNSATALWVWLGESGLAGLSSGPRVCSQTNTGGLRCFLSKQALGDVTLVLDNTDEFTPRVSEDSCVTWRWKRRCEGFRSLSGITEHDTEARRTHDGQSS